jgi:CheY-like chemotaxis protein
MKEWVSLALTKAQLEEEGYQVTGMESLEQALSLLPHLARNPDLIVLDTREQNLDSRAFEQLRRVSQRIPVVFCAGPFDLAQLNLRRQGFGHILTKPFSVGELVNKVKELTG